MGYDDEMNKKMDFTSTIGGHLGEKVFMTFLLELHIRRLPSELISLSFAEENLEESRVQFHESTLYPWAHLLLSDLQRLVAMSRIAGTAVNFGTFDKAQ